MKYAKNTDKCACCKHFSMRGDAITLICFECKYLSKGEIVETILEDIGGKDMFVKFEPKED